MKSIRNLTTRAKLLIEGGDITEQKTAEARLREALQYTRGLIEASLDPLVTISPEGKITDVNQATEAVTGVAREQLIGSDFSEYFTEPDKARAGYQQVFSQGTVTDYPLTIRHASGRLTDVLYNASVYKNESGEVQGVFAAARDITEQKRTEEQVRAQAKALRVANMELEAYANQQKSQQEELASANEELRDALALAEVANRSKDEFLANMSHEIRTPMTAILGFTATMLDRDISDSDRLNAVHTVRRNGEHLLQIINDILDVSKIEVGKLEVEHLRCSPVRVVADVKSLMQVRADAKGLPFKIEYEGAIPETIQSDPTRLKQILVNLIGNAIKFTETGDVRLVARFVEGSGFGVQGSTLQDVDRRDSFLQFDVIDTGLGMTEEQVGKLFQAFTQANTSTTRKFGGTGLGLIISKQLAEMLGGDVTVDSKLDEGSTFRVTVTTGPLDGVKMLDDPATATITQPEPVAAAKADADKLDCRILLAEDGLDNQRLIAHFLKKAGAEVTVKENGKLAAEAALAARDEGNPFDVILMDMQMPVMDGYEATGLLRQKGYTAPIIALTAHAMASDRQKCINAGCDDYVSKPIGRKKLIKTIRQHLATPAMAETFA